jgi:hypothetical protein
VIQPEKVQERAILPELVRVRRVVRRGLVIAEDQHQPAAYLPDKLLSSIHINTSVKHGYFLLLIQNLPLSNEWTRYGFFGKNENKKNASRFVSG